MNRYIVISATIAFLLLLRIVFSFDAVQEQLARVFMPLTNGMGQWAQSYSPAPLASDPSTAEHMLDHDAALAASEKTGLNVKQAQIVRKDIVSFQKRYQIALGSSEGVEEGDAVLSNGVFIGRIAEVRATSSLVQLITDPSFRVTAQAVKESDVHGIVKTEHGSLLFDLVPKGDLTKQSIETDGIDAITPPGILIGNLTGIVSEGDAVFSTYTVELLVPLGEISFVEVVVE